MIYLAGGAPGAGKSILGQQVAANLKMGFAYAYIDTFDDFSGRLSQAEAILTTSS
jgi:shikimate kinase